MASIGHIAVGLAAGKLYRGRRVAPFATAVSMLAWSALALLPDADVIGFGLGVRYRDAWGHRGATHSLLFAAALGLVIGQLAPVFGRRRLRTTLLATAVLMSHGLLDTLTTGGLGCALCWPFELQRYFAPWRPIPVAPLGARFFSSAGARVALVELVQFAPFWLYGLWPRRRSAT